MRRGYCLLEETCYNARMSFFWQAVLVEGGLAVIAFIVGFFLYLNFGQYCWCDSKTIHMIIVGLLPLLIGYFVLQILPLAGLRRVDSLVRNLFWQHMGHLKLWQLALIAALAGIGEELFFRGLIQLWLSQSLDVWVAVLISSLIFGLAHAITPTYFVLTFVVSLYFGWLFVHTGNLIVPIAVHALYDFFVFLFVLLTPHKNRNTNSPDA